MTRQPSVLFVLTVVAGLAMSLVGHAASSSAADLAFPALRGRVVDDAHILSPQQAATLDEQLAAFEQRTSHQLVVVTLQTLHGSDIADYGYQLGRHWQIGRAGKNNGVLLIVVPSERQTRIEVGYGVEGDLTDAISSVIVNRIMIPAFQHNDYAGGIMQGAQAIMAVLQGEGGVRQNAAPASGEDMLNAILILFLIIYILYRLRGGRSAVIAPFLLGQMLGGGGSGSGGGGFRGGGGSFGGGGASGRW